MVQLCTCGGLDVLLKAAAVVRHAVGGLDRKLESVRSSGSKLSPLLSSSYHIHTRVGYLFTNNDRFVVIRQHPECNNLEPNQATYTCARASRTSFPFVVGKHRRRKLQDGKHLSQSASIQLIFFRQGPADIADFSLVSCILVRLDRTFASSSRSSLGARRKLSKKAMDRRASVHDARTRKWCRRKRAHGSSCAGFR